MSKKKFEPPRWLLTWLAMLLSFVLVVGSPVAAYANPSSPSDEPSTSQVDVKKDDNKTDKKSSESAPDPKPESKPDPKPTVDQPKPESKPDPKPTVDQPKPESKPDPKPTVDQPKPESKPDPKPTVDQPIKTDPVADPVEKPKVKASPKPEQKPSETAKPETTTKPEQPAPKVEQQLDLEGYTCEGVWNRERTVTTPYVWNGTEWVLGEPEYGPWGEYFKVRDITFADAVEFGCIDGTPPTKADVVKYGDYNGPAPTCENPSVEHFRTIFTTKFTYDAKFVGGEWQWVESSTTTEAKDPVAKTVTLTEEEAEKCRPEQPAPKVEQQLDLEGYTCEGVWNRERTVTTYFDKWDGDKWVAGTVKEGPWGEYFKVRDLTLAEALEFGCIGDKPVKPDQIKYGEYEGAQPTCENPSVEWSRTIFTTKFTFTAKFVDGEWQWVESSTTTEAKDPVTKTVTLSEEDAEKCKPTPKPTPSETARPKPSPSTSTPPASTPPSGDDEDDGDGTRNSASALPLVLFSLLGAAGLGGLALVMRRRRNAA